jgi:hypothetical protein
MPEGAEVVMPWRKIPRINPGDSGAPAYGFATNGSDLYANFFEVILKMPLAGGDVSEVFKSSNDLTLGFKSFQDDTGMVLLESGQWTRLPFSGGAPEGLGLTLPPGSNVFDFEPSTDSVWAEVPDFSAKTVSVVKGKLSGGAPETEVAAQPQENGLSWVRSGDRFFSEGEPSGGERPIYSAQKGGAPAPFKVDPPSGLLLGGTKNFIYYQSSSFSGDTAGVYRVPVAGGKSERIYEDFIAGASNSWRDDDALYINDANHIIRLSESRGAKRVTPVPTGACTSHQVLVHGGYVYVASFVSLSGENQIWRLKE